MMQFRRAGCSARTLADSWLFGWLILAVLLADTWLLFDNSQLRSKDLL